MNINDFEPEYSLIIPGGVILIEKNGGGTVGKKYMGELWSYVVIVRGEVVAKGNDLHIGRYADHAMVAHAVSMWFEDGEL